MSFSFFLSLFLSLFFFRRAFVVRSEIQTVCDVLVCLCMLSILIRLCSQIHQMIFFDCLVFIYQMHTRSFTLLPKIMWLQLQNQNVNKIIKIKWWTGGIVNRQNHVLEKKKNLPMGIHSIHIRKHTHTHTWPRWHLKFSSNSIPI